MMRIGVSLGTAFGPDTAGEGPSSVLAQARAANLAGLDMLTVGDHHVTAPGAYLQNVPTLGRLLAEWDDRPAGCLFLLPLWHPVLMAEQVGTLAALAAGTFIVQVGAGGGRRQFQGMGVRLADRRRFLEEAIPLVQALLRGEEVRSATWGVEGARIAPVPARDVEWWIGAEAPGSIDRAARLGDCWYANADLTPETARALLDDYREACARHGREPVRLPIRKDVHIAESRAEAERVGDALIDAGYRGFAREAVAYGDPESVAEQLSVYGEMGFTDILIRSMTAAPDAAARSMTLAGEVRALLGR
jgi:alkanesulfonate monooxygenase SsuD/methylene tetrahydromethanopterin reductase-like flavin-dependent oxidoreductase (luciferase family)